MKKLVLILIFPLVISGCLAGSSAEENLYQGVSEIVIPNVGGNLLENPQSLCVKLCQDSKSAGQDLSAGPCLSNNIIEGWVCDSGHDPREEVDRDPSNQCESYISGEATHFVEVSVEDCHIIASR